MSKLITYKYGKEEYPVIYLTADCVVFIDAFGEEYNDYICLIKRKDNGKLALPGGYVDYNETTYNAAIRELAEETNLIHDKYFKYHGYRLFDDPDRNTKDGRNRGVTVAHIFTVPDIYDLHAGDDAKEAMWLDINKVLKLEDSKFHDDHKQIINETYNKFIKEQ